MEAAERSGGSVAPDSPVGVALHALVHAIERRLRERHVGPPPDAFLLGQQRHPLIEALRRGLLGYVAVIDWPTFHRLSPLLCRKGLEGLHATVALSLPEALRSGVTADVVDTLERGNAARQSVLLSRLTRATGGHIIFRSQLLLLADGECGTTPLEMAGWLQRHTPVAIRAMLQGRLIKRRPDLTSEQRQALIEHATRHLGRLLPEPEAHRHSLRLLRLAYYRLQYPSVARHVLRRVRVIDFGVRRTASAGLARPSG